MVIHKTRLKKEVKASGPRSEKWISEGGKGRWERVGV